MIRFIPFFFIFLLLSHFCAGQKKKWQQKVNYTIDVQLDDINHSLTGFETIEYYNNSPDTLRFLWVHLWMNAFKNDKTSFSEQQLQNGDTKFYFSSEEQKGYINRLNFQTNQQSLILEDHPNYIDIVKLILNKPLAPGQKTMITTPFHVKLPYNFSRGGHINQSYQITQWFPKVAMYDQNGWHEMPYLDQGEFYSNFGDYKVTITVPDNYVVAATGKLDNAKEIDWLKARQNFQLPPKQKTPTGKNSTSKKKEWKPLIESSKTYKSLQYIQDNVVDFAWFADKEWIVNMETVQLSNGKDVLCQTFYHPKNKALWSESLSYLKRALLFRSNEIGNYPYSNVSVVDASMGFGGGMEYPTITSIGGVNSAKSLDMVIEHEVGHNWFQAVLANNERKYPWLDEGLNTYYDNQYEKLYYPAKVSKPKKIQSLLNDFATYKLLAALHKDQPIETSSTQATLANYGLVTYGKTALWFEELESQMGAEKMKLAMQSYFQKHQFTHPAPNDLDSIFAIFKSNYSLNLNARKNSGFLQNNKPSKKIMMLPAVGYNFYNKIMVGGLLHNFVPSEQSLRFSILPMFSFKTGNLNGLGKFVYNYFPKNKSIFRIDAGLNIAKFNQNQFKDERSDVALHFLKIAPFVRFTLKEKEARSPYTKSIQIKHFNRTEENLRGRLSQNPGDTFFGANAIKNNYYVNQLQLTIKRNTALYPFQAQLQIEQMKDIIRSTLLYEQFFNYNSKNEGLQTRFFIGKTIYLKSKSNSVRFENDRYALNLLSPKGNEDYTYSNYFVGRNEFEGFSNQQILQRDGFFKFRTDLLANKPGRNDDWIASANFVTDIPAQLNPLSALPIKIPLKLFLDLGTYSDVWKKNASGNKIIYNGGLQLSILKGLAEIYFPLVYSKELSDYSLQIHQKKRSTKNISFSLNANLSLLQKFIPPINF